MRWCNGSYVESSRNDGHCFLETPTSSTNFPSSACISVFSVAVAAARSKRSRSCSFTSANNYARDAVMTAVGLPEILTVDVDFATVASTASRCASAVHCWGVTAATSSIDNFAPLRRRFCLRALEGGPSLPAPPAARADRLLGVLGSCSVSLERTMLRVDVRVCVRGGLRVVTDVLY